MQTFRAEGGGAVSELDGTRTISIPSLSFNYVDNRLESIGHQGELYYRERGTHAPYAGSRWHELFGTPERAAVTLVRTSDERAVCKLPTWTASSSDYDAWLRWLRGDA